MLEIKNLYFFVTLMLLKINKALKVKDLQGLSSTSGGNRTRTSEDTGF